MARTRGGHIQGRAQVQTRLSAAPGVSKAVSTAGADAWRSVSRATFGTLGQLSEAATGFTQGKLKERAEADTAAGQQARSKELLEGGGVQEQSALEKYRPAFRRGYLTVEATSKLADARMELTRKMAQMEPDEDPRGAINETLAPLLEGKEFQDPEVRAKLAGDVENIRSQAVEFYRKNEMAEFIERQQEQVGTLVRTGIKDGSLLTQEGFDQTMAGLATEDFGFIQNDERSDIFSTRAVDLMETGESDPDKIREALQNIKDADGISLWDRRDPQGNRWADRFDNAAKTGANVRAKIREEQVAVVEAQSETRFSALADRGAFSESQIFGEADKLGKTGKELFSFVRYWTNQNEAGRNRIEAEAKAAARNAALIKQIAVGNVLQHKTSELRKAASQQWVAAFQTGDSKQMGQVIERFTKMGVKIPEIEDMMARPTKNNLAHLADLHSAMRRIDPIVAGSYLDGPSAPLIVQHLADRRAGMSAEESIAGLPVGMNKVTQAQAQQTVSGVWGDYAKARDPSALPGGRTYQPWMDAAIKQKATRLMSLNGNLDPTTVLKTAEAQVLSETEVINGVTVRRAGMRVGAAPAVNEFIKAQQGRLKGEIDDDILAGVTAMPSEHDGNTFYLAQPNGFPLVNPKTGRFVTFDPNNVASAFERYRDDQDAAEAQHIARQVERASKQRNGNWRIEPEAPTEPFQSSFELTPSTWNQHKAAPPLSTSGTRPAPTTFKRKSFEEWASEN
jgi:hypothetical protein